MAVSCAKTGARGVPAQEFKGYNISQYRQILAIKDNMLSINFKPSGQLLTELGQRAKQARLHLNLSRQTLAERSGVPASSIKRFENTGQIGLASLIDIMQVLDRQDELEHLFMANPVPSIRELDSAQHLRQRGRQ